MRTNSPKAGDRLALEAPWKHRKVYSGCNSGARYCIDKPPLEKLQLRFPETTTPPKIFPLSKACWLAITVGLTSLLLQAAGLVELLRFGRQEIYDGQLWRILTGNLVHLGYPHLLLNLAGLTIITALLAHSMTALQWFIVGLVSMLGVGVGLLLLDPQLSWYVGLSGALYGLLLGGAVAEFRNHRQISLLLIAYTLGKIIWEQLYGAVESSEKISGGTVIVNAHLYGMVAGGLTVMAMLAISYRRSHRA